MNRNHTYSNYTHKPHIPTGPLLLSPLSLSLFFGPSDNLVISRE